MTCREAEGLVMPYINDRISDEDLEEFLAHIKHCTSCKEELEIYFTVDVGIRQLDSGIGTFNIKGELEQTLVSSAIRVKNSKIRLIVRYGVSTLSIMSLIVMILLQWRIWWQQGIF